MARRPSGDLETCSLPNALLSCLVHTPCPAWGCGCPHAVAAPHRGRVGDSEGTWGRQGAGRGRGGQQDAYASQLYGPVFPFLSDARLAEFY